MNPSDVVAAFQNHNWLAFVMFAALIVRTWLTDKSKFPMSLPVNWQPVVLAVASLSVTVTAGLENGVPASTLITSSLAWAAGTGFLDGLLVAIFGDPKNAPAWAKFFVMIFDRFEGSERPTLKELPRDDDGPLPPKAA